MINLTYKHHEADQGEDLRMVLQMVFYDFQERLRDLRRGYFAHDNAVSSVTIFYKSTENFREQIPLPHPP